MLPSKRFFLAFDPFLRKKMKILLNYSIVFDGGESLKFDLFLAQFSSSIIFSSTSRLSYENRKIIMQSMRRNFHNDEKWCLKCNSLWCRLSFSFTFNCKWFLCVALWRDLEQHFISNRLFDYSRRWMDCG